MLTLSDSLLAHQSGKRRVPRLSCSIQNLRSGYQLLEWTRRVASASEPDAPHAIAVCGDFVLRARLHNAAVEISRIGYPLTGSAFPGWQAATGAISACTAIAIAAAADGSEALILANSGTALKVWTSADQGSTWSGPTTLVTEGSDIGSVALAFKTTNTNCCAFYTLGTTATLKRLRRTSGTWAGSGTTWSKTGSVATLTGLAATHDGGDYQLAITGTEVTTLHPKWWAVIMGDGNLPANVWSDLVAIAEADADSSITYQAPSLALISSVLHAYAVEVETGDVAFSRAVYSHATPAGALGNWLEPFPSLLSATTYGIAIATAAAGGQVCAGTPYGLWTADNIAEDLTSRLIAASWRLTPESLKVRLDFDDHDGALLAAAVAPGYSVVLTHGYASGAAGATENGYVLTATIDQVRHSLEGGLRSLRVEAHGAWEEFASWRAPRAWQVAAGVMTRAAIFERIAARAGVAVNTGTGARAPSAQWTSDQPAFAVAAGETGESLLRRLLAVTPDFLRPAAALEVVGFDTADTEDYAYGINHGITALAVAQHPARANWTRLQGPDRYADALDYDSTELHRVGPRLQLQRNLDAATDGRAQADAEGVLRRSVVLQESGELTAAANVGHELFDVVSVTYSHLAQSAALSRVIALSADYRRGPKGQRFDTILTLGGL